ncbi:MAG: hypothetical protein ABSB15_09775 [Bryobacteraceae bacterium]
MTILAWLYIAVGTGGFVSHLTDGVWVELVELAAVIAGAFMLRGTNWARWLAVAWMAFHLILSAFHAFHEIAVHSLFLAVIAWLVFRSEAARYFRGARIDPP